MTLGMMAQRQRHHELELKQVRRRLPLPLQGMAVLPSKLGTGTFPRSKRSVCLRRRQALWGHHHHMLPLPQFLPCVRARVMRLRPQRLPLVLVLVLVPLSMSVEPPLPQHHPCAVTHCPIVLTRTSTCGGTEGRRCWRSSTKRWSMLV